MQTGTQKTVNSSPNYTFWVGCGCAVIAGMVLILLQVMRSNPSYFNFHGPVAYNVNELDVTRNNDQVKAFSPDESQFAYIWRDAYYKRIRWNRTTLRDSLKVKWFPVQNPLMERSIPLDSIDARSKDGDPYKLEAQVLFSPDSKHLAALSPNVAVIADTKTGDARRLKFEMEHFCGLRWLSNSEVVFSTTSKDDVTYWRLQIGDGKSVRRKIHRFDGESFDNSDGQLNYRFPTNRWSPDGRFDIAGTNLLNLVDGTVRPLSFKPGEVYWRPDSSAFVSLTQDQKAKFIYMDALNDSTHDVTDSIYAAAGKNNVSFEINGWTADGQYILCAGESDTQNQVSENLPPSKGFLFQPTPFKVALRKNNMIWPSPLKGWVFSNDESMKWEDYTGTRSAPIEDFTNLTWSRNGTFAAKIQDKAVKVFRPTLPH